MTKPTPLQDPPAAGAAATIAWVAGGEADFYGAPYRAAGWFHINVRTTINVEPYRAEFGYDTIKFSLLSEVGMVNGPASIAQRVLDWLDAAIAAEGGRKNG